MNLENLKGGHMLSSVDGRMFLVLERFQDLPVAVADMATGSVLLAADVFVSGTVPSMCLEGSVSA
jgi:hypothetical protein